MTDEQIIEIVGSATFLPDLKVQEVLDAFRVAGLAVVPVDASFGMRLAGAEAITEDHMQKMANYDIAIDCWKAMIAAATNLG
jgi:hypothetical protein